MAENGSKKCLSAHTRFSYRCSCYCSFVFVLCSIHSCFSKPAYLFQLLKERKALQEKSMSRGSLDRVSLKFEEIDRSTFEVILKYIYTGDVIIPEQCQLDDVTCLAER